MKILYYSPHPNLILNAPSGYGTHMREMIVAFEGLGHEVYPLIMGGIEYESSNLPQKQASGGLKQLAKNVIPSTIWESVKDFRTQGFDNFANTKLTTVCEDFQPDLIYERAAYMQLSGIRVAQELNIPHILEINAPMVEERIALSGKSFLSSHAYRAEIELLDKTDRICIVSSILRDYYSKRCQVPKEKFQVVPNAINFEAIRVDKKLQKEMISNYNLSEDDVIIGFVGSIFPWHGVDLMIDAFAQICGEFPQAKMLIVGDGEIKESLIAQAMNIGLVDKIIFTGNVPHNEVFSYIDLMDITVLGNSHWYGSPIKIFEYGAMEKAIIAPERAPVKEVIEDGKDGLIISASIPELVNAYRKLLHSPELRKRLASNFYQKIRKQHTWEQMAKKVLVGLTR